VAYDPVAIEDIFQSFLREVSVFPGSLMDAPELQDGGDLWQCHANRDISDSCRLSREATLERKAAFSSSRLSALSPGQKRDPEAMEEQ